MRVYFQRKHTSLKIDLHAGDICRLRAKECLHEIANQCEDLQSTWYNDAHDYAQKLANHFKIDLYTVCKLIAILSPRQRWETNKRMAWKCLMAFNSGCRTRVHMYSAMSNKAYRFLNGENEELAQKTGPFCQSIFKPNDDSDATIDTVAVSILIGMYDIPGSIAPGESELKVAQEIYREVAQELGVTVPRLQAATWEFARKAKKEYHGIGNTMVTLFNEYTSTFVTDRVNPYQYASTLREIV